jgi:NTP pyrophosphatase (non-canonical NTP hydrolase)
MTPTEYQKEARRTMSPHAFDDLNFGLAAWGLGLAGEAGEVLEVCDDIWEGADYDEELLIKEIGDCTWYAAALCEQIEVDLGDLVAVDALALRDSPVIGLVIEACKVADYVKKVVAHDHALDRQRVIDGVTYTMAYVKKICVELDFTLERVMQTNIDKLKRRYPTGFDTDASKNRTE